MTGRRVHHIAAAIVGPAEGEPGRVVCRFTDALGVAHSFIGPVELFTTLSAHAGASFPVPARMPCEVLARRLIEGRELVQVDTDIDQGGLSSTEGLSWFMVAPEQVLDLSGTG